MTSPSDRMADAVAHLRAGGLVCIPTETSYGLAADIRRPDALAALVALKGRDQRAPFGLIAGTREQVRALCRVWPPIADELARKHWPGPLTLVVPARADLPPELIGPGGGVGVRISSHPLPVALAQALGGPITATSANPSGQPPARDPAAARAYFGDAVFILPDSQRPASAGANPNRTGSSQGAGPHTQASTVAAIDEHGHIRVLRPGPIAIEPTDPGSQPAR